MNKNLVEKFNSIIGEKGKVLTNEEDLACYSYDAYAETPVMPEIVVKPTDYEQIQQVIKLCNEENIPIVTRGAGSNLSGGTIPKSGGCVLLTTGFNKILEINENDLYAVVQSGVVTATLAKAVEAKGLFYPPDPGSMNISTIGGNVAENAGGLRGLKYGVTKDYVMGVNFFDPEGNSVKGGGKTVKLVTGFNLQGLMVSSEGLLGVMTDITLKLIPKPKTSKSMIVFFDDVITACEMVSAIISSKIVPTTLEFLDNFTIRTVEDATKIGLPTDAGALLLIEVDGYEGQVEEEFSKIFELANKMNGRLKVANNIEEKNKIWEARRKALSSLARLKPTLILEDATVPRSKIPSMMRAIQEITKKYNLTIGTFGHAGDGNLHPTILTDRRDKNEMEIVEKAIDEIFDAALNLDGTLSGEHGVGTAKAKYLEKEVGKGTILYMKKLKKGIDPKGILNPHKMGI
ncbi:MAG: FAD-binding protein [Calditerrivibrio sp.]|nr:FAD-binding protein [Calditerrivibrio sp.]MCA1933058.1 FAD-binding protein [Calditerrivibrio sp.]MCA1979979.1 FAD-binding protein [Calditerrivibrio sp.]